MLLPVTGSTGGKRKKTVVRRVNASPVYLSAGPSESSMRSRTILQIGPRIGPRVKVGSGREGGRKIFRPLTTTSRTTSQYVLTKAQVKLTWNRVRDVQEDDRTRQNGVQSGARAKVD